MRIAQLAPTYERVPPAAYGGTEHIVHLLTEELVRRGHDVTLYATGDSLTAARLRSVTPQPVRYGDWSDGLRHAEYFQLANVQACFIDAAAGAFDIVHNHAGLEGLAFAATSRTPVLTTNHNPFVPEVQSIWDAYPWAHHAVSQASAATFPSRGALPPIHHGIDVESFPFGERPEGYLLFLGRFSPEKGAARAIAAARADGAEAHPGRQGRHGRRRALPQRCRAGNRRRADPLRRRGGRVGQAGAPRRRPTRSSSRSTGTSRSASS